MVVDEDDRGGPSRDRVSEDVGEADDQGVEPALVDERDHEDLVLRVEDDDSKLLLR